MYRHILALTLSAALPATAEVGFTAFDLPMDHHDRAVGAALWYPAGDGGAPLMLGENPVFNGVRVMEGAAPAPGAHPLVVLSHGLGGHYRTLGWLAAGLAEAGAVVIAANHPASTTRDFDLRAGLDHWTRAQDMSALIDHALSSSIGTTIDAGRITAGGFSYGGWSALSIAGVRGNLEAYAAHCEAVGAASTHCADIARGGVDLRDLDAAAWDASYADPRITSVAVIDPALHFGLTADHVAALEADVLMIALGDGPDRLLATDFGRSGFADLTPQAQTVTIAPAQHFSALLTCTDVGALILAEEGDDPVCDDPVGADRAAIHAQIIAQMVAFLEL